MQIFVMIKKQLKAIEKTVVKLYTDHMTQL